MLDDVLAQPGQFDDALWRVESAGIPRSASSSLVLCGMGGSAIGADLARAAIGERATAPISVIRGYDLPAFAGPESLVVCSSYSGTTEETLSCFEQAGAQGAARVVVTPGGDLAAAARDEGVPVVGVPSGMQPRAAVVYMTLAALECAAAAGVGPSLRDEIAEARDLVKDLVAEWGQGESEPYGIARALEGRIPAVYGGPLTGSAAVRWCSQLNENSKVVALGGRIPEANHNEVVGWRDTDLALTTVLLDDPAQSERIRRRFDVTAEILVDAGIPVERVEARGDGAVARLMSLVLMGDLVSVHLAELRGVDPTPVEAIDDLKRRLG
jgi:glucose/mannose-6-phosphate isomerase